MLRRSGHRKVVYANRSVAASHDGDAIVAAVSIQRVRLRAWSLALAKLTVDVPGCLRNIPAVQYSNEVIHELGSADAIVWIYVEQVSVDRLPHGRLEHLQPLGVAGHFRVMNLMVRVRCCSLHLSIVNASGPIPFSISRHVTLMATGNPGRARGENVPIAAMLGTFRR